MTIVLYTQQIISHRAKSGGVVSYQLYDVDGYVGDFSNGSGLKELRTALTKNKRTYPDFYEFIINGTSFITEGLIEEINNFIKNEKHKNNKRTVVNLKKMLQNSELMIIISQE
jgi:hypothetical protein